uniref:Putative ixodes 8-cys protein n=1 Tax=Ixodes ricinus TaxID=34613 RepID=A0A0K8RFY4_IXORI
MKVVCIILLFVIAADAASINEKTAVKTSTGNKNNYKIKFNYPPYIRNHHDFASKPPRTITRRIIRRQTSGDN